MQKQRSIPRMGDVAEGLNLIYTHSQLDKKKKALVLREEKRAASS